MTAAAAPAPTDLVAGDQVAMKSGGPAMTVAGPAGVRLDGEKLVEVYWFNAGGELCRSAMPTSCLDRKK